MKAGLILSAVFWSLVVVLTTGCAMVIPNPLGEGLYASVGDERGILANADHDAAMISEGKASPDVKGSHYQLREAQVRIYKIKGGSHE